MKRQFVQRVALGHEIIKLSVAVVLVTTALSAARAQEYTFRTLAGLAGTSGSADGAGSTARFYDVRGIAVDGAGNVYVGDTSNSTIRKITPGGVVSTIAGLAGAPGSADGTGSAARFSGPYGVAVDSSGNIYTADCWNQMVRKIMPGRVVSTLAGLAGNSGSADGMGSTARFNNPWGVAVDNLGNIYVADCYNHTIRKIGPWGVVTTVAGLAGNKGSADGTGSVARFNNPGGIAVDGAGNVYVGDTSNSTIRKIMPGGVVSTIAGLAGTPGSADGIGSAARFNGPDGLAVDVSGNVFVAEEYNNTIRKITPGGVVSTIAGLAGTPGSADGMGSAARFNNPMCVAVDGAGNLYVSDYANHTIRIAVPAPVITSQSQSQSVMAGKSVTFSVTATGTLPLSYQWRKDGINITGATNSNYAINNIQPSHAGAYSVVVSNTAGSVTSQAAVLTVLVPPSITGQPQGQTVFAGTNLTLSVVATGSAPLIYQWLLNGNTLIGQTSATLVLSNVKLNQTGQYTVTVSNAVGTVTSQVATLTVKPAPTGSNQLLSLDGKGAYVTIPSAAELQSSNQITIEAWIYPVLNTNNPNAFFISKGAGSNLDSSRTYELYWTPDNRAYFSLFTGQSTWSLLGAPVAESQWTHIAATYDGLNGLFALYTNGVMAASTAKDVTGQFSLKGQLLRQTTAPLVFGCSFNGATVPGTFATGQMDEVRIYNRALSGQEILQGIGQRLSGSESNLVGYWTFDNGMPSDASGSGHDGTLAGQASITPMNGLDILHNGIGFVATTFDRRGQVMLSVTARNGVNIRIDASTNLVNWLPVTTIQNTQGTVQFTDPDTLKFTQRYYRAVLP